VLEKVKVHGIAHITGGGFYDNISRILPKGCAAVLNRHSWRVPAIFSEIQDRAGLDHKNMYKTFNMGVGMTLILDRKDAAKAKKIITKSGLNAHIIGEIVEGKRRVVI
jgi:phosphoribosylformylglycinamidine cyclo-ligase